MKLIEFLVKKHYEEGWEWPDKAHECHRHAEDSVCAYFYTESGGAVFGAKTIPVEGVEYLGVGDDGESVTRDQYEAALAASKEMLVNNPVAWDGQGLPPVGAECEYKDYSTSEWHAVTITYCSNQVVVFSSNHKTFKGEPVEISKDLVIDSPEFRPVRTEAQRKRKEAVDAIAELCRSSASNGHSAELIYAAIEAGSIPGVKLEAPDED